MDNIRKAIREAILKALTEMSATGGVAGYETPFAFVRKPLTPELGRRVNKLPKKKKGGYKIIPQGDPKGPSSDMIRNEVRKIVREELTLIRDIK